VARANRAETLEGAKPNRLIAEKSPYLIKHAYNPVDWFTWGDEAIGKAKREDKPIFLSIGYSTCHWCTVMERESFENPKTAAILNERFVPIKVDREERPDVDDVYMKAVVSMTGQGGWPLSVFLTPDLKPFYGGTYFPPEPRHGLPAFPDVLNFVAGLWKDRKAEVLQNSDAVSRVIREDYEHRTKTEPTRLILDNAYAVMVSNHDPQFGGFGGAPKFPLPGYLDFLLRYYARTGKEGALKPVLKTLEAMAGGGIHDQLAGGFHRYSTDRYWLVPHFEKMLYDNALLAKAYLDAYRVTGDARHAATARDVLDWVLGEMTSPEGGFYSAQDADTPEGEGYYYTWTPSEVSAALGPEDAKTFCDCYGVTKEGNFEGGRSILSVSGTVAKASEASGRPPEQLEAMLRASRQKLLKVRRERNRPAVDDKVIASWNGLTISAMATAHQALRDARYLEAAERAAGFVLARMVKGGQLYRRYREGDVAYPANLEDHSFLVAGLIDLYEASFDPKWLEEAVGLADKMVDLFWDGADGGFFLQRPDPLLPAIKEGYDGPTPSGNSVAALDLLRLAGFTGREAFNKMAETVLELFSDSMESAPSNHAQMLGALDLSFGSKEIVVAADTMATAGPMLREIGSRYLPTKVLVALTGDGRGISSPLTEGKVSLGGKPTTYICENFACEAPITDIKVLRKELGGAAAG